MLKREPIKPSKSQPIKNPVNKQQKEQTVMIGGGNGLKLDTAYDCMICGEPFIEDWEHMKYNMCPKCREKIRSLIK